jgi:hypothetical protein
MSASVARAPPRLSCANSRGYVVNWTDAAPQRLTRPLLLSTVPPRVRRQTPDPASVAGVARVCRVFLDEKHSRDFATSSKLRRKGNWSFQVLETPESHLASSVGGREDPKPFSSPQTPSPSQMCQHQQVITTLCMCVSIFIIIFKGFPVSSLGPTCNALHEFT